MPVTVAALLQLPLVAAARPEVLHGDSLDEREVRWVHTSEIYEIAPLLKGGEALLTTGLGLVGAGPEQLQAYVVELAVRGVTALFLELGRTFPQAPPALVAAARDNDLVLVALHGVVPFVEVTETVSQLLLAHEVQGLRAAERVSAELTDSLLSGSGLPGLLRRAAGLAGCSAALLTADGRVVAASDDERAAAADRTQRPVEVFGVEWGRVVLHGPSTPEREVVLDRVVVAVALELVRSGGIVPARREAGRELLRDLASERFGSTEQLAARAAAVGLVPRRGQALLAVCVGLDAATSVRAGTSAATEAARRLPGTALVADLDGEVLLAATVPATDDGGLRGLLVTLADTVDAELAATTGGRARGVAAGPLVADVAGLVRSVRDAREASRLARRLGTGVRTLLSADVGVHRLLSRLVGDPQLERFVDEQLGVLLAHDARTGRELVRTLDTYLACGGSKTRAAAALGVRRQTLYGRLERVEALLGGLDLSSRERRTALDLALLAWRLRANAVGYVAEPDRPVPPPGRPRARPSRQGPPHSQSSSELVRPPDSRA